MGVSRVREQSWPILPRSGCRGRALRPSGSSWFSAGGQILSAPHPLWPQSMTPSQPWLPIPPHLSESGSSGEINCFSESESLEARGLKKWKRLLSQQGLWAPVWLRIQVGAARNSWPIWGILLPTSFCVPNCKGHKCLHLSEKTRDALDSLGVLHCFFF